MPRLADHGPSLTAPVWLSYGKQAGASAISLKLWTSAQEQRGGFMNKEVQQNPLQKRPGPLAQSNEL